MVSKADILELAAFGGPRVFDRDLPVGQVYLPKRESFDAWFDAIFERGYYTNHGPLVAAVERAVCDRLAVAHAAAVTNGTVALMVALTALEATGEVIVPAFTFPATVQALHWCGLTPVFADVDPATHMLTVETVDAVRTERTSGILGVHLWGGLCDPEGLQRYADRHRLFLLFDACHGFGCGPAARPIGHYGDAEVFSFHATKVVNAAEGGCVVTNDDALAAKIATVRNFHRSPSDKDVPRRINGKMTEAQSAMALMALGDLEANIAANKAIHDIYRDGLAGLEHLTLLEIPNGIESNYQYAVAQVSATSPLSRDTVLKLLRPEGVLARRYFAPGVHKLAPYQNMAHAPLPMTERLCQTVIQLPLGAQVSPQDAEKVVDLLTYLFARARAITTRLGDVALDMPGASR